MNISIIVPFFNPKEEYVSTLISEFLLLNPGHFEVIFVNDGSNKEISEYVKNECSHHNFIYIESECNKGVSHARNIGIKNSSFQYLFFVDADDLINVNYLNNISEKEYEDFIIFRSDIFTKIANDSKKELQVLNIEENVFEMYENENVLGVAMRSACGKIFDKKIIEEQNLFFDENLSFYEDAMFVSNYYQFVKQFVVYDNVIYHYRIYSGSSSKRFNKSYIGKYQMFFDKYKNNFFKNKHLMNSLYKDTLCSMTINKVIRSFKKFHYFYCFKIVKSQCVIESSKKIIEFDLYKNDFQRKLANKIIKRRYFSSVNLIIFDHFKKFIKVRFHK